jgi:hypothetical protein
MKIISTFKNIILHQQEKNRFSNTNTFHNLFYTLSEDINFTNKK